MKLLKSVLFGSLLAFAAGGASAQVNMRIATDSGAQGSPSGNAIDKWAQLIEEGTNGEIKMRVFYQNQLGGQQEVFDQHIAGDVQLMLNWPMTTYDKRISVIYTPYMFTTWEGALNAYQPGGWLNTELDSIYADNGIKFLGAWPEGFNGVATKGKHALTVDGDAANVIFYDYEYFRDTLDYYVRTKQQFITGVLSMNLDAWNKLTPSQQTVVQDAATQVMEDQFRQAKQADQEIVDKWTDLGKNYIEPEDGALAELGKNVREKVWPLMEKDVGTEIMNSIKANATQL